MPWDIRENFKDCRGFAVVKRDDDEIEGCHETREAAEKQMRALYASENRADLVRPGPIEHRRSTVGEVSFPERTIEVLALPYNEEALIEYRGELWRETVAPGAFAGVETRDKNKRVKAFRTHEDGAHLKGTGLSGLIGEAVRLEDDPTAGLGATVEIAPTPLGDETLTLASRGLLGVSLGMRVRGRDQEFNRADRTRRIHRAFVDHIAFPDYGAYEGAGVLAVRSAAPEAADLPRLDTPLLDDVVSWMQSRRTPA